MHSIASSTMGRACPVAQNRKHRAAGLKFIHILGILSVGGLLAGCAQSKPSPGRSSGNGGAGSSYDPKLGVSASPRVVDQRAASPRRGAPPPRRNPAGNRVPKGGGSDKLGKPYRIAGRWYVPRLEPNYNKTGTASWYGDDFHGRKTANGEIYDMNALSAAHTTMPLPSYAYVTNLANGRTVLVRVNDRGPYAHGRIIDMSRAAATALDYKGKGLAKVRVRYAGRAPMDGSDAREQQFIASQPWYRGQGGYRGRRGRSYAANSAIRSASRTATLRPRPGTASNSSARAQGRTPTWHWRPGRKTTAALPGYAASANTTNENTWRQPRKSISRNSLGATAPRSGLVSVRAGTFMIRDNAERMRRRLSGLGRVAVEPVMLPLGLGYRVSVGPVAARDGHELRARVVERGVAAPLIVTQ